MASDWPAASCLLWSRPWQIARFHGIPAVGCLCGIDPAGVRRPPQIQRILLQRADSVPWVAELIAKSGRGVMRQRGLDWYLERAFRSAPLNRSTVRNPDWMALIRNAREHLLKQGPATFVLSRHRMDTAL